MKNLKIILLAEDNPNDVELTLEAMAENKLANQVTVVRDGVEVMEYLLCKGKYEQRKKGNPALILLDIKMPRMDGIQVLQKIRNEDSMKRIPIVMLTSSREENDLVKSYDLGVNAYVVKPVDFKQFIEAVKQIGAFWAVVNELPPDIRLK